MLVKEIMAPTAEWVSPDTCIKDTAVMMRDMDIGSVVVQDKGRLIGLVTDRDIACRCVADGANPEKVRVRDIMSKNISWCFDDQDITEAAHLMEDKKVRRLPVLNHDDHLIGMLSVGDFSHCAPRELAGEVMRAVAKHH